MMRKTLLASALCGAGMAFPALADEDAAPVCEHKGTNGMVTMLLCPEGLELEKLANEGKAACDGRMPCGAWIWTDASFIPEEAPDAHDKLSQESVQNALAIWVNEDQKIITLERTARE